MLAENEQSATKYTVVVDATEIRTVGVAIAWFCPDAPVNGINSAWTVFGMVPNVALVVEIPTVKLEIVEEPPGLNRITPLTSQSPAVSDTLVALAAVAVVRLVPLVELVAYSPMLPALALSLVVVPTMPAVLDGVIALVAWSVVNLPAAAAVVPIAGGDARYVLKPVPLTVLDAESVVNAPVPGVVEPIGPGAANVAPPSCAAFTAALQVKPVLVVYVSALELVEQDGIAKAVGLALDPVTFATTVLAACDARLAKPTFPVAVNVPLTVRLLNVGDG
ncbi:hypothetical protein [Burkholderia sp. GbtcB21]|uniref:hypothetical protein n=1 Tax=Burkholderia sp. GbtcB21 TaxID=2824766 RepID=UPI001C30A835|nr:hypothetical protein [Burkholderia sp. GbtcB21]